MVVDFNTFVIFATIAFYFLLKRFVSEQKTKKKRSSNLIYVFFIPIVLYIGKYLFTPIHETVLGHSDLDSISSVKSNMSVTTSPYPDVSSLSTPSV